MITIASSCLLSITPYDISQALPLPASSLSLEQSVERLEKADSRTDTLQAMVSTILKSFTSIYTSTY